MYYMTSKAHRLLIFFSLKKIASKSNKLTSEWISLHNPEFMNSNGRPDVKSEKTALLMITN